MPSINVERSISIKGTTDSVFAVLSDFNQWRIWSPWLITESKAEMTVSADGQSYQWQGERVGQGVMTLISSEPNQALNLHLTFLKPWKSTAQVQFYLSQQGDEVEVTWAMQSSLPFFMFWLKNMMQALIGMDYERGLLMLKDYLETGTVACQLSIQGKTEFSGATYLGVKRSCLRTEMIDTMPEDFASLMSFVEQYPSIVIKKACAIYHKFDLISGEVSYTAGLIIENSPGHIPEHFILGEIPTMKVFSVMHTGSYHYLGNAWSMIMGLQRAKKFKQAKAYPPFELYHNNPREVAANELMTEVIFACK